MKTKDEVRIIGRPEFYTVLYFDMKKAALELGYTLSMHGSMHSDMDLIAVAWVHDAKPVEDLVKAINDCLGNTVWKEHNLTTGEEKPHGRLSYSLSIGSDWHIDLSVMAPCPPVIGEEDRETKRQPIEDALYATRRFLTTEATDLAEGILDYLNDYGFTVTKSLPVTGESEAIGERKFTLKQGLEIWDASSKGGWVREIYFMQKFGIEI